MVCAHFLWSVLRKWLARQKCFSNVSNQNVLRIEAIGHEVTSLTQFEFGGIEKLTAQELAMISSGSTEQLNKLSESLLTTENKQNE